MAAAEAGACDIIFVGCVLRVLRERVSARSAYGISGAAYRGVEMDVSSERHGTFDFDPRRLCLVAVTLRRVQRSRGM